MQTVVISEQKRNSLKGTDRITCPNCGSTDGIGNVITTKNHKNENVTYRYYCRECFLEFDSKGRLYPPLY